MDNLRTLFTEEEWKLLLNNNREVCEQIKDIPLHFEELNELEGEGNE